MPPSPQGLKNLNVKEVNEMSTNYVLRECSICHQEFFISPDLLNDLADDIDYPIGYDRDELVCLKCFDEQEG